MSFVTDSILPRFFRPGVVVANHAESGETIKSFVTKQRFAKTFTQIPATTTNVMKVPQI